MTRLHVTRGACNVGYAADPIPPPQEPDHDPLPQPPRAPHPHQRADQAMKYNDAHLAGTSSAAAETIETSTRDLPEVFAIEVTKTNRRPNSPLPRFVWLDVPAATELRDELNDFLPHDPTQIAVTVPEGDFEVQTISAMLTLLNRHDETTQVRILSYLMDRRTAGLMELGVTSS